MLVQPSKAFATFAAAAAGHSWRAGCPPASPGLFPPSGSPAGQIPAALRSWIQLSQVRDLALVLLNSIRFLSAHSPSPPRSSRRVAFPSRACTSPLSLGSSAKFTRVHLIPSSRSLTKTLDGVDPLVTGRQFEKEPFPPRSGYGPFSIRCRHRLSRPRHLSAPRRRLWGTASKALRHPGRNVHCSPHTNPAVYFVIEGDEVCQAQLALESALAFPSHVLLLTCDGPRWIHSTTFPGTEVGLMGPYFPGSSFQPFL